MSVCFVTVDWHRDPAHHRRVPSSYRMDGGGFSSSSFFLVFFCRFLKKERKKKQTITIKHQLWSVKERKPKKERGTLVINTTSLLTVRSCSSVVGNACRRTRENGNRPDQTQITDTGQKREGEKKGCTESLPPWWPCRRAFWRNRAS